jgi:hypothetical protein
VKRATFLTTLAVALTIGLTACGDDDTDDALSTSEYQDRGNQICESVDAEVSAVLSGGQPTVEQVQSDLAPRLSAALRSLGDGLVELQPPSELADAHAGLVSEVESASDALDAAVDDRALATRFTEEGPPMDGMVPLAAELGLTACLPGD